MEMVYKTLMAAILFIVSGTIQGTDICSLDEYIAKSEIVFEDDFDSGYLDPEKWERCPEGERHGDLNVWDDSMSYIGEKDRLVIEAQWNSEENKLHSGGVWTKGIFEGTFGYYEASVKMDYTPGLWSSFWMMTGHVEGENHSSGDGVEIDIIESYPLDENEYGMVMHWDGYGEAKKKRHKALYDGKLYDGNFHTYGVWRRSDAYIFYIDREEVWRVSSRENDICPLPGYMVFSTEGAGWAGTGSEEAIKALPAKMLVDYVRVYQMPVPLMQDSESNSGQAE